MHMIAAKRQRLFARMQEDQAASGIPLAAESSLLCPLCWVQKEFPEFTEDHIVPESIGGNQVILTCKSCNNRHGSELDSQLSTHQRVRDAIRGSDTIQGSILVNGQRATIEYSMKPEQRSNTIVIVPQASNPGSIRRIMDELRAGQVDEANLTLRFGYNSNKLHCAWVRVSYLAVFNQLGYRYLLSPLVQDIRAIINNPELAYPKVASMTARVQNLKAPFDRPYFMLNCTLNEIPAIQVIIRSRKHSTSYKTVFLPGLGVDSSDFFRHLEELGKEGEPIKVEGISIDCLL